MRTKKFLLHTQKNIICTTKNAFCTSKIPISTFSHTLGTSHLLAHFLILSYLGFEYIRYNSLKQMWVVIWDSQNQILVSLVSCCHETGPKPVLFYQGSIISKTFTEE